MKGLIIVCCLLVCVGAFAQAENELFGKSKGTLTSGLKYGIRLKTDNIDAAIRPKATTYITYSADSARAVFEGTVAEIVEVPNHQDNYIVTVTYGDYTVSYAFLRKPIVAAGAVVKRDQSLGALAPVPMGPYYFMIQIYKGDEEIDTLDWFQK